MATYLHRDTQGPCPDGYHIPTYKDWKEVYDAGVALGQWSSSNGDGMRIKLKMPFAKFRERNTGDVRTVSNDGYYWFSDYYSGSYSNAYTRILNVGSTSVNVGGFYQRPHSGCSIRPFKNIPTIPNSNWTIIYAGSNGAGIFYNSTEGVISISSDGTTWYTIADKNLGATTVYNDGATLSETNCGKFYQWGNNYGFPWTGTVTTSSTQVNASGYGPGKYYSSSTFIARGDGEFGWDSSGNRNLRGGVTDERVYDPTRIIKKFYHMGVEYKIKGGKPTPTYKTYTVTFDQVSSPTSRNPVYSDDAVGLTAGSTEFDTFFGYSGVRLNGSGVETASVTQTESGGAGKLDITKLGTLTSGDNVMIKFPLRGVKMSTSGTKVTLSITDDPNKEGYQYYAFTKDGDINNPGTPKSCFYLGAYLSSSDGAKSLSGATPTSGKTLSEFITASKTNGTNYNIMSFYQREYINALYMMKYGNPDSQTVIGKGNSNNSTKQSTGGTNANTNASYGTNSATVQVKLFGLEDWWGNMEQRCGGAYTDANKILYVSLWNYSGALSGGVSTGKTIQSTSNYYCMSTISGDNKAMFMPTGTVNDSNFNTYWCDYASVYASSLINFGGMYSQELNVGAFHVAASGATTDKGAYTDTRLCFLGD